jgi:hypothetical protein
LGWVGLGWVGLGPFIQVDNQSLQQFFFYKLTTMAKVYCGCSNCKQWRNDKRLRATRVKNKTQWQSSFRWYKYNHITKTEQHTEAFYTSTERGGAYDGEWIPEESLDEASKHNGGAEEDSLDEVDVDIPLLIETNFPPPVQLNLGENPDTSSSNMISRMTRNNACRVRRKERMDAQNGKIKEQQREIRKLCNEVSGLLSDGARMQRVRESNTGFVFQRLKGYATGLGKWKRIAYELFTLKWITPYLIRHTVDYNQENVYTRDELAEATDRVPGFILRCVEGFRGIQNAKKNTMKMVCSSGTI